MQKYLLLLLGFNTFLTFAMDKRLPYERPFFSWKMHCDACLAAPAGSNISPLTYEELEKEIDAFCKAHKEGPLSKPETWVETGEGPAMPGADFFYGVTFEPYVQKIRVNDKKVLIQGDLHGDVESANKLLEFMAQKGFTDPKNPFRIIDPKFRVLFLGDYTDRGNFGAEVLYIVSRLKRTNPEQFFAACGNHENIKLNETQGLAAELNKKFGEENAKKMLQKLKLMYNYLPVAVILQADNQQPADPKDPRGSNSLWGYHGGPELGFRHARKLLEASGENRCILVDRLMRETTANETPTKYQGCYALIKKYYPDELTDFKPCLKIHPQIEVGFLWSEFKFTTDNKPDELLDFDDSRGFKYPKGLTHYLFENDSTPIHKIRGALRAHQHSHEVLTRIYNDDGKSDPSDAGVAKIWLPEDGKQPTGLWDGIVCTFGVAPNVPGYKEIKASTYNAVGLLTPAEKFEDWRLEMHRIESKSALSS